MSMATTRVPRLVVISGLFAAVLVACRQSPSGAVPSATSSPTAAIADRATPVGGNCGALHPIRVNAAKHAFAQDDPGYWNVDPVACYTTIAAAEQDGNQPAPGSAAAVSRPSASATGVAVPPVPARHSFNGIIGGVITAPDCGGGYDLWSATVVVRDEKDTVIASATTDGSLSGDQCVATFTLQHVPKARFYQLRIGTHGGPTYSFADLDAEGWVLLLNLH